MLPPFCTLITVASILENLRFTFLNRWFYLFPLDTVTTYHKLDDFRQKFIISQSWRQNSKMKLLVWPSILFLFLPLVAVGILDWWSHHAKSLPPWSCCHLHF